MKVNRVPNDPARCAEREGGTMKCYKLLNGEARGITQCVGSLWEVQMETVEEIVL